MSMTTEQTLRETFIEVVGTLLRERIGCRHGETYPCAPGQCSSITFRDHAAQLYDAVTALNGPMEEIVRSVEEHARQGVRVACVRCGRMKKPRGRSAALEQANSLCDAESCDGYASEPHVGTLWPGESCRDFGYAHSHDGTELTFDPAALSRAITVESLGGAKVSEAYGEIVLMSPDCLLPLRHRDDEVCARKFEVPRLTIEGAQS